MLTRFVRKQFINNKQIYRGLSYYNNDNKNNDTKNNNNKNKNKNNNLNNGHISAEEYSKDAKYDMIRDDLDKIDNKVEWLILLVLPTWFATMAQAIYTLLH
jgi:hypothetical protein